MQYLSSKTNIILMEDYNDAKTDTIYLYRLITLFLLRQEPHMLHSLKRRFAAFYSLVDCEFFRQTETP